ncbi:hypothetical protein ANTHOS_184 [Bacillus phage Anthos]|uniref:Uncharacterized protein n=2 Tax=Caudoviricetes TaxID=2731619 RepID=A0A7U3T8U4_9CAUD|nr:hypothetical protein BI003_gp184 [Bacillus phage Phrodo]QDH49883.1 hypothetical protein BEYONPHE_196 [Bacillus phage Beyonphe]QPY77420.1 hypothetical protein ANTHOS_184 [Bacillus phage Anthos]UGO48996.1 hypothetical protein JARJAR_182 [Bacillus phage vB_BanH_JarJar]UGO50486.1 hypothetical protein RONSWANSON_180 [Bacillus phage vB_BanH_RonSwanson]AMW62225.1 hypothetical protein PHRODO_184 [Bacillus phage Phrodo]
MELKEAYIVSEYDGYQRYPVRVFESKKEAKDYIDEKNKGQKETYPQRSMTPIPFKPKEIW